MHVCRVHKYVVLKFNRKISLTDQNFSCQLTGLLVFSIFIQKLMINSSVSCVSTLISRL